MSIADLTTTIAMVPLATSPTTTVAPSVPPAPPISVRWDLASGVIAFWLVIQLACLTIVLLHIPLAAEYGMSERLGPQVLLAAQIISAAVLAPRLCATWTTAALAAATTWPALLLAGALAARPTHSTVIATVNVNVWMLIIWAWLRLVPVGATQSVLAAGFALIAGGGVTGFYLLSEFNMNSAWGAELLGSTPVALAWESASGVSPRVVTTIIYGAAAVLPSILSFVVKLRTRPRFTSDKD